MKFAKRHAISLLGMVIAVVFMTAAFSIATVRPDVCRQGADCTYYGEGGPAGGCCAPGSGGCGCTWLGYWQTQSACSITQ
jgi:hypothetical protein